MTIHLSKKVLLILAGLIAVMGTVGAVVAINHNNQNNSANTGGQPSTDSAKKASTNSTQTSAVVTPTPTPTKTPTPQPTTPAVDVNAVNAKLCKSIMDNAKSASINYNKMYFDGQKSWQTTYQGDYDSPEAIASKEWNINYIKKLYSDYINSANPSYSQACGSGGSVADVMYQPNYDLW